MNKEERALELYPVVMTTLIPADNEHPLIEQDCNKFTREAYIKGYNQAEKDNELAWEDIREICRLWIKSKTPFGVTGKELSKEVLKQFRDFKERKNVKKEK